jgi:hypothetical protein
VRPAAASPNNSADPIPTKVGSSNSLTGFSNQPKTNPNVPVPPGDLSQIGWCGDLSREAAADKLKGHPVGTFLIRYSPARNCYVLSYNAPGNGVKHIDSIWLENGQITVLRQDQSKPKYPTMYEYIDSLRTMEKLITSPISFEDTLNSSVYELSGANRTSSSQFTLDGRKP